MTNKQDDDLLHDLFRKTLNDYRPEGNVDEDWEKLFPNNERKPMKIWWYFGGFGMVICLIVGMFLLSKNTDNQMVINKKPLLDYNKRDVETGIFKPNYSVKISPKHSKKVVADRKDLIIQNEDIFEKKDIFEKPIFEENITFIQRKTISFIAIKPILAIPQIEYLSPEENEIKYQMLSGNFGEDSTTYRTFGRNINLWSNSVIVSDFTTSMYPYSTQIFAWLNKNSRNLNVKGTVFFTDCDSLGNQTQKDGGEGQMFLTEGKKTNLVLKTMLKVARNTQNNHDAEENDLEALLFAEKHFATSKQLILIADNDAPPKDMKLLSALKKPVHVVLCGTTRDYRKAFQDEYLEIAQQTHGSLHTLEDDIDVDNLDKNTWIKVGKYYYHYKPRRQEFKVSKFNHRPVKILGFLWF